MNLQQLELAARRARLVERSHHQRAELARRLEPLQAPLALIDRARAGMTEALRHPAWIAGGVAALVVLLRTRGLVRWTRRGWLLWRLWSLARTQIGRITSLRA